MSVRREEGRQEADGRRDREGVEEHGDEDVVVRGVEEAAGDVLVRLILGD